MKKIKQKPKIDFTRNRLLRKVFNEYDITFSLTLDTADYIDRKYLNRYKRHVWKDMRRNLKRIPSMSRKQIRFQKIMLLKKERENLVKEKGESERSERIKSEAVYARPLIKCRASSLRVVSKGLKGSPCLLD